MWLREVIGNNWTRYVDRLDIHGMRYTIQYTSSEVYSLKNFKGVSSVWMALDHGVLRCRGGWSGRSTLTSREKEDFRVFLSFRRSRLSGIWRLCRPTVPLSDSIWLIFRKKPYITRRVMDPIAGKWELQVPRNPIRRQTHRTWMKPFPSSSLKFGISNLPKIMVP